MNDEKKLKRKIKTIWDALRHERRARSKMYAAAEVADSAQRIAGYAMDLKDLGKRMAALEAGASSTKARAKAKPKSKLRSAAGKAAPKESAAPAGAKKGAKPKARAAAKPSKRRPASGAQPPAAAGADAPAAGIGAPADGPVN